MGRFISILSLVFLMNACRTTSLDKGSSSINSMGANWQTVLACEGGSVIVDVDTNDRRRLQLVIRNQSLFNQIDATIPYGQIRNTNERIYSGQTASAVDKSSDFVNFYEYDKAGTSTERLGFEARAYGNRLVLRALDFVKTKCAGSLRGNDYTSCEVANYTFQNCQ